MTDDTFEDRVRRALDLVGASVQREAAGVSEAIDDLCRKHQDLAPILRALGTAYRAGKTASSSPSFRDLVRTPFVDPEKFTILLDLEAEEEAPSIELSFGRGELPHRYLVKGEVARGGMGVIYRVRDSELNRTLAMKVLSGGPEGSSCKSTVNVLSRFLEEAQVTAQLDHPGIVAVHELGMYAEGRPFFTMKLVKGREFSKIVDLARQQKEGWNLSRAVGVLVKVCQTIAYAHSKKVIHRDLKPANIMVGRFGEVFVMDWGLAKVIGREDTHDLRLAPESQVSFTEIQTPRSGGGSTTAESPLITMDGSVVGTPAFMPPEQARGEIERVDHHSDVYALGAVLYQLLTGQPPYVEPAARISPRTILARVLDGPPHPVPRLNPEAPPELVAICEKAMARDPSSRYGTSLELAEDLQAWLDHRVVGAYRTGPMAELKSWVIRNRLTATIGAAALVLLVSIVAWWAVHEHASSVRLHQRLAQQFLRQGQSLCEAQRIGEGLHLFVRARDECPPSSVGLAADIDANLFAWAGRCNRLIQYFDHESDIAKTGASASSLALAFSPDGNWLVTGGRYDRTARIWSIETGEPIGKPMAHDGTITSVFITNDGGRIITATEEGTITPWSPTGEPLGRPIATGAARLAFHQPRSLLAVADRGGSVTVWSAESGMQIGEEVPSDSPVTVLEISRDGTQLLVSHADASAGVWTITNGEPVGAELSELGGRVVAFSPDATKMVVVDADGAARLWSVEAAEAIGSPIQQGQRVLEAKFSPDGALIATASADFTVRLWSGEDGAPMSLPMLHRSMVMAVEFSPAGDLLVTGSTDFTARLWSTVSGRRVGVEIATPGQVRSVAFSRDGKMIAVGSVGRASIWSADVLARPEALFPSAISVWGIDISPDGEKVVVGSGMSRNAATIWSRRSRERLAEFGMSRWHWAWVVKFSPDGRYLVAGSKDAVIFSAGGEELRVLEPHGGDIRSAAFDPTGTRVAVGDFNGKARVWSVPDGELLLTLEHPGVVEDLVFARDGKRLITACGDGKARCWSLQEKKQVHEPLVHSDSVLAVNVSPDGRLIATGSRDQTARFWDVETGRPWGPILEHANWVEDVDFSPDGRILATACADGNVQLWSVESGEKIGPPFPHNRAARAVVFDPDGRHVLTGAEERDAKFWSIPGPGPVRVHDLRSWVEAITGERMDEKGVRKRLSPIEWRSLQEAVRAPRTTSEAPPR